MIEVISRPIRQLNGTGLVSRWNAVHHPIKYTVQRKDVDVASVDNNGGNARVNTSDPITEVIVGETVYINAGSYIGNYPVLSKASGVFTIDTPYTATATGYVNLVQHRVNYYLATKIYDIDSNLIGTSLNKPHASGLTEINISTFLKQLVGYNETFGYNVINDSDATLGGSFTIDVQQWYNGSEQFVTFPAEDPYYFTNSAKQVKDLYGANMGEYVMCIEPELLNHTFIDNGSGGFDDWVTNFAGPWVPADIAPDNHGAVVDSTGSMLPPGAWYIYQNGAFPDFITEFSITFSVTGFSGVGVDVYFGTTLITTIISDGIQIVSGYSATHDKLSFIAQNDTKATLLSVTKAFNNKGKFLSDFVRPTYFNGLPFSLSFIYSELVTEGFDIYRQSDRNLNDGTTSTETALIDQSKIANVNRLLIKNNLLPFSDNVRSVTVFFYSTDSSLPDSGMFSEKKEVKIGPSCEANPVYLNWLGTLGGRNTWLFSYSQSNVDEIKDLGEFFPQVGDLETDLGNGEFLGKTSQPELVCSAYLEAEDLIGLKGLLRSPDVLMLSNPDTWMTDGAGAPLPKWTRVRVLPQTYKVLETNQTHALIELTLLLPTINIQQQ